MIYFVDLTKVTKRATFVYWYSVTYDYDKLPLTVYLVCTVCTAVSFCIQAGRQPIAVRQ